VKYNCVNTYIFIFKHRCWYIIILSIIFINRDLGMIVSNTPITSYVYNALVDKGPVFVQRDCDDQTSIIQLLINLLYICTHTTK